MNRNANQFDPRRVSRDRHPIHEDKDQVRQRQQSCLFDERLGRLGVVYEDSDASRQERHALVRFTLGAGETRTMGGVSGSWAVTEGGV